MNDMVNTTADHLEGSVGGSFMDDLLGRLNYPQDILWKENDTHVEAWVSSCRDSSGKPVAFQAWRRSKEWGRGTGDYVEEWIKIM